MISIDKPDTEAVRIRANGITLPVQAAETCLSTGVEHLTGA
jgi:hypothetical protein